MFIMVYLVDFTCYKLNIEPPTLYVLWISTFIIWLRIVPRFIKISHGASLEEHLAKDFTELQVEQFDTLKYRKLLNIRAWGDLTSNLIGLIIGMIVLWH